MLFSCKWHSTAKALNKKFATYISNLKRNKNKNEFLKHGSYIRFVSLLSANVGSPPQKLIFIEIGGREKCFAAKMKKTRFKLIYQNQIQCLEYDIRHGTNMKYETKTWNVAKYISLWINCSCNELKRKMNKKNKWCVKRRLMIPLLCYRQPRRD